MKRRTSSRIASVQDHSNISKNATSNGMKLVDSMCAVREGGRDAC